MYHIYMHLYVHGHYTCTKINIYTHALKCIDRSINHFRKKCNKTHQNKSRASNQIHLIIKLKLNEEQKDI